MSYLPYIVTSFVVLFPWIGYLHLKVNSLQKQFHEARSLISEETKRKQLHIQLYEDLVDPDKIAEEMERSADIVEARQANRLLAPRPDAGPPARVFRPKFVGKRASFWNPPRS